MFINTERSDLRHDVALAESLSHVGGQLVEDAKCRYLVLLGVVVSQFEGKVHDVVILLL